MGCLNPEATRNALTVACLRANMAPDGNMGPVERQLWRAGLVHGG